MRVTFDLRFDKPVFWLVCSPCGCMLKTHLSACVAYTNNILRHIIHTDRISPCYLVGPWTSLGGIPITTIRRNIIDFLSAMSDITCPSLNRNLTSGCGKKSCHIAMRRAIGLAQINHTITLIIAVHPLNKTTGSDPITAILTSTTSPSTVQLCSSIFKGYSLRRRNDGECRTREFKIGGKIKYCEEKHAEEGLYNASYNDTNFLLLRNNASCAARLYSEQFFRLWLLL